MSLAFVESLQYNERLLSSTVRIMAIPKSKRPAKPAKKATRAPIEDLLQVRFARLYEIGNQLARYSFRTKGLRTTDLRIMNLLLDNGELSINELARRSRVDKAWVSRSVAQLLAKRWLSKQNNPNDARAQLINLTPKSRDTLEKLRPAIQRNETMLLQGINEKQLKRQLDKVLANASELLETMNRQHKRR